MFSIRVFEHQSLKVGERYEFRKGKDTVSKVLEERYIAELWKLYDEKRMPYFKPIRGGVRFCEWVGVVKVLDLTVEILPKADRSIDVHSTAEQNNWQRILVDMLRVCRNLETPSQSDSHLTLRQNSILELYIQRFLNEVNGLVRSGLIKKYKKEEKNSLALKGRLLLHKHIANNIVHQELFYISQTAYDTNHLLHRILFKALKILPLISNNQSILSNCHGLLLNFPEVDDIKTEETLFDRITFDRKSASYKKAIQIAKLLLLNCRPDITSGRISSIAILFDMNLLWEEYIFRMLQKSAKENIKVHGQKSTMFWYNDSANRYLRPDIVIEHTDQESTKYIVVDTKWKNIYEDVKNVGMDDIRQMFAYNHYFNAEKCFLLYPGEHARLEGNFFDRSYFGSVDLGGKSCGVIFAKAWTFENNRISLDVRLGKHIFNSLGLIDMIT